MPLIRYFIIGNLATSPEDIIRLAGLLRGTESAAQAVSYGLNAVGIFARVGGLYLNFGLWGIAIAPAWYGVVQHIGTKYNGVDDKENEGSPTEHLNL